MAYDPLRESVKLIAEGLPPADSGLTRRRRFLPLAVDRAGGVAATAFMRRGHSGEPLIETWALELRGDEWRVLGGGGDSADPLAPRPPAAELRGHLLLRGSAGAVRRRPRWRRRWVRWSRIRAAAEVDRVAVRDRSIPVPWHGLVLVVWTFRPPRLAALDAAGTQLQGLRLSR